MAWSAFALRCLLLVAFCLDGGTSLWKVSQMAAQMASQPRNVTDLTVLHHEVAEVAVGVPECDVENATLPVNGEHDDCACDETGHCDCPCTFAEKLLAYKVPFSAQHALPAHPPVVQVESRAQSETSAVFRPPIA